MRRLKNGNGDGDLEVDDGEKILAAPIELHSPALKIKIWGKWAKGVRVKGGRKAKLSEYNERSHLGLRLLTKQSAVRRENVRDHEEV